MTLIACAPDDGDGVPLGQPLRVGETTFNATDAQIVEWMRIEPDHPDRDPQVWRPATLYMREREFVPEKLGDADVWVSVRLDVFSDADATEWGKDQVTLIGGDGEAYSATYVRDLLRDGDAPPKLPRVVASASNDIFVTTVPYPDGGPGSIASVEAVYAVPIGAAEGAELRIVGDASEDGGTIVLGPLPFAQSEGAPRPYE